MSDPAASVLLDAELLTLLLQRVPARVVVIDREHRYRWANPAALDFLGLPAERVIGATIAEVRGEQVMRAHLGVAERLFAGEEQHWEGWTDYPTRGRCYTEEWLLPVARPGEPVRAVIAFARDLTELKRHAQQLDEQLRELQRAEALKTSIVDHAGAAIVSADADGRIVEFNPAAEAMFGIGRDAALGRPVDTLLAPASRAAFGATREALVQDGAAPEAGPRWRVQALRGDGQALTAEVLMWRTAAAGRPYVTVSLIDVSERERATEVIERQRDALRQSEKLAAMGGLLAGVAHELNNPLAIVMGRASLLEEKAGPGPLAEDAARIREAADRCGRIVRTFLDMARRKPPQRRPVVLNELVQAAADMLQYGLRTRGIALELRLDPALPAVNADPDQIGQVVLNLMVNAQQALGAADGLPPAVAPRLVVSTGLEPRREGREPRVWLRVADNGPGVPEGLRASIFEPFFTTKPEGLGTGQGLAVSRTVAAEHGGHLVLEDSPAGQGASFRLSLPQSGQVDAAAAPADRPEPAPGPSARVLVVDDEAEIAELMREMLDAAGHEVWVAESGAVALAMLQELTFDVIVSDLRMPDMDGAMLWREVRERHPALAARMLFVTGDTLSRDAEAFLQQSRCPSLAKPFARQDLVDAVRQRLSSGG